MKELKRPVHPFALILWIGAGIYLFVVPLGSWFFYNTMIAGEPASPEHTRAMVGLSNTAWNIVRDGLFEFLEFAAAGVMIDLLDAIRWSLMTPEERTDLAKRRSENWF